METKEKLKNYIKSDIEDIKIILDICERSLDEVANISEEELREIDEIVHERVLDAVDLINYTALYERIEREG